MPPKQWMDGTSKKASSQEANACSEGDSLMPQAVVPPGSESSSLQASGPESAELEYLGHFVPCSSEGKIPGYA